MIAFVKGQLAEDFRILEFLGIKDLASGTPSSPEEVYLYDIVGCVMEADFMLVICDHPALGLGYEIGTAVELRKIPVLALARRNREVSRLIKGIIHPWFHFDYYDVQQDIVDAARKWFLVK